MLLCKKDTKVVTNKIEVYITPYIPYVTHIIIYHVMASALYLLHILQHIYLVLILMR